MRHAIVGQRFTGTPSCSRCNPVTSTQKRRQESFLPSVIEMGLSGLEPPTSRLSGVRSDQLSYRPAHKVEGDGFEPPNPKGADLQSAAFSHFATPP